MSESNNPIIPHPASVLDDVVHHRARLGILTVLGEVRTATFSYLKSLLGLTDGNLGRHIEILAGDGLVSITKGYENRRPRTWVTITDSGDTALAAEMAVLKQLLNQFEERGQSPPEGVTADRNTHANDLGSASVSAGQGGRSPSSPKGGGRDRPSAHPPAEPSRSG